MLPPHPARGLQAPIRDSYSNLKNFAPTSSASPTRCPPHEPCLGPVGWDDRCHTEYRNATYPNHFIGDPKLRKLINLTRAPATMPEFIFTHVPKAGGTSMMLALHHQAARRCAPPVCWLSMDAQFPHQAINNPHCSVVGGHFSFGDGGPPGIESENTDKSDQGSTCQGPPHVTVLREPVARLISQFEFFSKWGPVKGPDGNTATLQQYMLQEGTGTPAHYSHYNLQTVLLCGSYCRSGLSGSGNALMSVSNPRPLEIAKQNILRCYVAVGTLEDLDATSAMLTRVLPGWFPLGLRPPQENTRKAPKEPPIWCLPLKYILGAGGSETLSDRCRQRGNAVEEFERTVGSAEMDRAREMMGHDVALYHWARQRLMAAHRNATV